jgi:replicative DNA helicase
MAIGGWIPTKVTTIAGRSGHGKTALTSCMFDAGKRVMNGRRAEFCFFTWEMESSYLVDRYITFKTGISGRMLTQGAKLISSHQSEVIKSAYEEAMHLPVQYQEMSTDIGKVERIFMDFCEDVKKKSEEEGVEIIPVGIIDYLGMAKFESSGLRTHGIGEFMSRTKSLCNRTGGAFCIIAQINRSADDRDMPHRADLSDSQSIEQNSDNLVILHRPEYVGQDLITDPKTQEEVDARNKMMMRVVKGRDFGIGDILMGCDIKTYRVWNEEFGHDFPYWEKYSDQDFWVNQFKLPTHHGQLHITEEQTTETGDQEGSDDDNLPF